MSSIDLDLIKAIDARIESKMSNYTDIGTVSAIEAGQVFVVFDGSQLPVPVNCGIGVLPFQYDRVGLNKFGSQWTIVCVIRGQDDYRGVPRFADNASRDAAITAPYDGLLAYTLDTRIMWMYNGSRSKWMWAYPQTRTLLNDTSVTNSIGYTTISDIQFPILNGGWYSYHGAIFTLAVAAGDAKFAMSMANANHNTGNVATDTNLTPNYLAVRGGGTLSAEFGWGGGAGGDQTAYLAGMASPTVDGIIVANFSQWTANASASWILHGSFLTMSQVA
jgi:hypothetical protein